MRTAAKAVQKRVALALAHLCASNDRKTIFVDNNGISVFYFNCYHSFIFLHIDYCEQFFLLFFLSRLRYLTASLWAPVNFFQDWSCYWAFLSLKVLSSKKMVQRPCIRLLQRVLHSHLWMLLRYLQSHRSVYFCWFTVGRFLHLLWKSFYNIG